MDYELWGTLPFPNHTLRSVHLPGIQHDKAITEPWGTLRPALRSPVSPRSKPTSARNAPGPRRLRGGRATGGALATAAMSAPLLSFLGVFPWGSEGTSLVYVWATRRVPARRARTGEQGNVMESLLRGAGAKPRVCGEGKSAQYFCGQVQCRDCCCLGGCVLVFLCLIFR